MSRTIRRVNYEKTRPSRNYSGFKSGGFYVECDYEHRPDHGHEWTPIWRPMTKQELNQRYWEIHGESKHNNAWGPNWYYRRMAERQLRQANQRELQRAMADFEYEAMFLSRYAYCWDLMWW